MLHKKEKKKENKKERRKFMRSAMVRKVDELGRVVIPKEMRRVLNIKSGSSVELDVNENNEIVLKKFSELSNAAIFAEKLANVVYSTYNIPCLVSDDDRILFAKGVNRKNYEGKQIEFELDSQRGFHRFKGKLFQGQDERFNYVYISKLESNGFECGYLVLLLSEDIDKQTMKNIEVLCSFVGDLLEM